MSQVRRFDHVGLTVADLDVVTAFFVALGLEVEGRTFVEGEFLDTVYGIPGSRTEIVMLKPPGDGTRLELSSFVRPGSVPGSAAAMANELGLRNVAFEERPAGGCRLGSYRGLRTGRWHRRVRGRLADGLRPGAGRDHRLASRAHRLSLAMPASPAMRYVQSPLPRPG
jgi:catechol 2,3-dioxygenase-like lactoylglutathione lyase family enzyme